MSEPSALPETAYGVLSLFEVSQAGIDHFTDQLIQAVQAGEVDALELRAKIKSMEMICERVNKATQIQQLTEADKHPGTEFSAFGVKFTKAMVYTVYDYSECQDPIYRRKLEAAEKAVKEVEERKEFLKAIKVSEVIIDPDGGEVVTIYSPRKKQTPGLKLSIK